MSELDELKAAIEALEAQRAVLADAAVAATVDGLGERLAALEPAAQPAPEGERKQTTAMFAIKAARAEEPVSLAERAIPLGKESRQQAMEAEAHRVLGWARHYAQPDAREPVQQKLRTALELHRKTGATVQVARRLYQMAAYLRLMGDEAGAAQAEAEASATARERGLDWLPTPPPTPPKAAVSGRGSER